MPTVRYITTAGRRLPDAGGWLVVVLLAVLVFAQGGFFALVPCLCGVLLCVAGALAWLRAGRRGREVPLVAALFLLLPVAYLASALRNGLSLTTLSACGPWTAVAGAALLAAAQEAPARAATLRAICALCGATAVLGLLVYVGALVLPEGMVGDRLQATFQYANAAAAWYGCGLLLCVASPDERLRRLASLPATAFLLTQSAGGLLSLLLVAGALGLAWARASAWERLGQALLAAVAAAAGFVLLHVARMLPAALLLLAALAAFAVRGEAAEQRLAALGWQCAVRALLCVLAAGALVALVALRTRGAQALASFVERLYQAHDGFALWAHRPVWGIGPNNWQYLYRWFQTAQYDAAVVHSSYVQVLLDAGLLGLCVLGCAAAMGVRALWRRARCCMPGVSDAPGEEGRGSSLGWAPACLAAAAFLLVHATLEFDLRFASLSCLLAWLLAAAPQDAAKPQDQGSRSARIRMPRPRGLACALFALLMCLPLCALGAMAELSSVALRTAVARGDHATVARLYDTNPLARADAQAQELHLCALADQGKLDEALAAYQAMRSPTQGATIRAAQACLALGQPEQAANLLLLAMEEQPYNVVLFETAGRQADEWVCSDEVRTRYKQAVLQANRLAGKVNPLLAQRQVVAMV